MYKKLFTSIVIVLISFQLLYSQSSINHFRLKKVKLFVQHNFETNWVFGNIQTRLSSY